MHISDGLISEKMKDPLHALPDDSRAQMSDMKRLGHIGSAVVNDDLLRRICLGHSKPLVSSHLCQVSGKKFRGQLQVQEARADCVHTLKSIASVKHVRNILRDLQRSLMILFCPRHRTVALVFTQVRTVGDGHLSKFRVITCCFKSIRDIAADHIKNLFHVYMSSLVN